MSESKDNTEARDGDVAVKRLVGGHSLSPMECLGVITNATLCINSFKECGLKPYEPFLKQLSDWFIVDRSSAGGAYELLFFKPNHIFCEVLAAAEAYARSIDCFHYNTSIGDDFSFRVLIGHNGIEFLFSNVKLGHE